MLCALFSWSVFHGLSSSSKAQTGMHNLWFFLLISVASGAI